MLKRCLQLLLPASLFISVVFLLLVPLSHHVLCVELPLSSCFLYYHWVHWKGQPQQMHAMHNSCLLAVPSDTVLSTDCLAVDPTSTTTFTASTPLH